MQIESQRPAIDDWLFDAACRGSGVQFHWDVTEKATPDEEALALAYCATCPVIDTCLSTMVEEGERYKWQVRAGVAWWRT